MDGAAECVWQLWSVLVRSMQSLFTKKGDIEF